jgi:hypothetical protein
VLAALNLAYRLADKPALGARPRTDAGEQADDEAMVEWLIARVDATLGDDGQLL